MTPLQITPLDVTRPALEILIDKVNALNSVHLQPSDLVLGVPEVWVGVNYDTKISLMPVVTSMYYNAIQLFYKRVNLATLFTTHLIVPSDGATHVHDVLGAINAAYGIYLTTDDVENDTIVYSTPGNPTTTAVITLVAKTTSPLFSGATELTLNLQVDQGISTYVDEQTYYTVVTKNGKDTIQAYNSLGNQLNAFRFLEGATVNASTIKNLVYMADVSLMMIGEFTYTTPNPIGDPIVTTAVAVKMDLRGNILGITQGDRFGGTAHTAFEYDPLNEVFFALDKTNALGGVLHRVHRYDTAGMHDNTFVLEGLTEVVSDIAIDANGNLYLVTDTLTGFEVHKRTSAGAVDSSYTIPLITVANNTANCDKLTVTADAFFVRIADIDQHNGTSVIGVNSVPLWNIGSTFAESAWAPIVKFDLNGVCNTTFNPLRHDRGPSAFGVDAITMTPGTEAKVLTAYSNFIAYGGIRVSPLYGRELPNLIVLDANTGMLQDTAGEFKEQNLVWDNIVGAHQNKSAEVVVWGTSHTLDQDGPTGQVTTVALYSRRGTPGGVFLTLTSAEIKFVLVYAEEQ